MTAFFITSPSLGLIMDPYFLFTYCKALEFDSSRFSQPGDLFVALVFICSVIMVRSVFFAVISCHPFPKHIFYPSYICPPSPKYS